MNSLKQYLQIEHPGHPLLQKVDMLDEWDTVERSILHEQGHHNTFMKLNYLDTNVKVDHLEEYFNRPEVRRKLIGLSRDSSKFRETLGEVIAEDWRTMQMVRSAKIPNIHTYPYDLSDPRSMKERHKLLRRLMGW